MKKDIAKHVSKCITCQQVKAKYQRPSGTLQPLEIPQWKWNHITTDFVIAVPKTQTSHDSIWVIMDKLTKCAHFLPFRTSYSLEKMARLYI